MPREITTPAPIPPMKRSAVRIKIFRRIFESHLRRPEKSQRFPVRRIALQATSHKSLRRKFGEIEFQ
jgi:hypothetical protein